MAIRTLSVKTASAMAVVLLLVLLLASLHLMSSAVQHTTEVSQWFEHLLVFTVFGLVVLVVLVGVNLVQLLLGFRRKEAGSRLTLRMVVLFVVLAITPVSVVYYYSLQFLLRGIDSWFDVKIDTAMEQAIALSQASLDLHKRQFLKFTEQVILAVEDSSETALSLSLGELRMASGASELTLMDRTGRILASSNEDPTVLVPDAPDSAVLQQVVGGNNYVGMTEIGNPTPQLFIRSVVRDEFGRDLILQALYPTSERISELSDQMEEAYIGYKQRAYLHNSLKFSFTLTLSLVLLAGIFAAAWAAFFTARRLVSPIADIAEGTRAVADGDYDKQLPMPTSHDELSFLVASFNAMTRRIAQARFSAEQSKRQLAAQHAYLETVLGGLSSGVMTLDAEGILQTVNPMAEKILRLPIRDYIDQPISKLVNEADELKPFLERLSVSSELTEGRDEISLYRSEGLQVILCQRSALQFEDEVAAGYVVVFDDVTTLVKAQRDAAWGEVARRLAHEIKNPLTPIQLSAERMRHKFTRKLSGVDSDILKRATDTIVQQVEALKSMVNAFSDYAKPSQIHPEPLLVDDFLHEVMALYEASGNVILDLEAGSVSIEADQIRLRQVLHNLVKNAQEALTDQADGQVIISSRLVSDNGGPFVQLSVKDNGPGFDRESIGKMFEPYVTTKSRGTGLGLAIVKKIIEEHGGNIRAENSEGGGGRVIICLPVFDTNASSGEDINPVLTNEGGQ